MECSGDKVGWVVGESTPVKSLVIFDKGVKNPVKAGDYVVAESEEGCVLGIVETIWAGHRMLPPTITDPEAVNHIADWTLQTDGEDIYNRGSIRWLTLLEPILYTGKVVAPKTPVTPGASISRADPMQLSQIFSPPSASWTRIGSLSSNPSVSFHIDVNGLTRHLAILAVTGGGKSNTVCVLSKRIVGQLCGTMVIFDMHGEYSNMKLPGIRMRIHKTPALNPVKVTRDELYGLLGLSSGASRQRRYIMWAWRVAVASYQKILSKTSTQYTDLTKLVKSLIEALGNNNAINNIHKALRSQDGGRNIKLKVESWLRNYLPHGLTEIVAETIIENEYYPPHHLKQDSIDSIIDKVEDIEKYYGGTLDVTAYARLEDAIPPCSLTVFDLSELDEDAADAVVSHYLRRILTERKKAKEGKGGYPLPVIVVLEEAHVLVPKVDSRLTKRWAARIAREGRKFGVGLVLVSQRPKNVDPDVLSQTNNKIILRMVEPEDIRYVQRASEEMSDDIASMLPTLNPGEAIVFGKMAKLPALVKVDLCPPEEKPSGGDIDIAREWRSYQEKINEDKRLLEAL